MSYGSDCRINIGGEVPEPLLERIGEIAADYYVSLEWGSGALEAHDVAEPTIGYSALLAAFNAGTVGDVLAEMRCTDATTLPPVTLL